MKDLKAVLERAAAFQEDMEALGVTVRVSVSIDLTKHYEKEDKGR